MHGGRRDRGADAPSTIPRPAFAGGFPAAGEGAPVDGQAPSTRAARRAIFDDAVAIVEREYARDLNPEQVARRVATSRRQLQRVFAEIGGTTFREYLTRVRLERAAHLLREDRRPVPQIARAVGFRSASAFSVAFRRHHGVPPGAIRGRARSSR
jgi:AraC family transcriptional regulator of adaptative response / methylphosphotriester-DNA alkyltransferase methyltransferase